MTSNSVNMQFTVSSTLILIAVTGAQALSGQVFCDQGDAGITSFFAGQIIASIGSQTAIFGVPGTLQNTGFGPDCLSTSQTGSSSCCQVAFQNFDGQQGTVTMTSNTRSTGADAEGGSDAGSDLQQIAQLILQTCWTGLNNDLHSGRWAGPGFVGSFQVGLSGGTC
jgi:hypothetical protein